MEIWKSCGDVGNRAAVWGSAGFGAGVRLRGTDEKPRIT